MVELPLARRSFLAVAAAGLAGVAAAQTPREVTIGLSSTSLGTAAPRIAKELGLFTKYGIDPKFIVMESGNAAVAALVSRSVDYSVAGPGDFVMAKARGQNLVVLANSYNGLVATLVLAKAVADRLGVSPGAPVNERLRALDGLIIGSPSATSVVTTAFGGSAKAAGANIRFTYMSQQAMPAALESGAVQGYGASAPFWAFPVVKGVGVLWINGPKGEVPPEFAPSMSTQLQAAREFAEANRELTANMIAVLADFAHAIDERPADVKAALGRLYPNLDQPLIDLLFINESPAWKGSPLTIRDLAHEIAMVKATGVQMPQLDTLDPASMLFR
jgi:ABC-type nitrate/sulfonate/bicarbonate transport system substrate-binding protein